MIQMLEATVMDGSVHNGIAVKEAYTIILQPHVNHFFLACHDFRMRTVRYSPVIEVMKGI